MMKAKRSIVIMIFIALFALLAGCNVSHKQTVPEDTDPDSLLQSLYTAEHIKSVKSAIIEPLNKSSEIEQGIRIYYQYAILLKGAVDQENKDIANQLYIVTAVENTQENREISVQYIGGSLNGEIRELRPRHKTFQVNACRTESDSPCDSGDPTSYEAYAVIFSLDEYSALEEQGNVVDITVRYALGKNKKELREQFLSDSGLQETGKAAVSFQLPAAFH
ncbi:hypothetical protein KB559_03900 [Paenibacillus sp. Marseille-P2973]|uniref:hypothetical protein n=1 Tax=Paenibacillus sp. Marseille-P2973 TaxID=1871032 RepID=UPI001B36469C|nr:hypothetical protein [Paenibacillus sp. Marseille-P2973]MBQ4897975.1 hypothetical protein [Paenibacillus sp. Marseille-P2973]